MKRGTSVYIGATVQFSAGLQTNSFMRFYWDDHATTEHLKWIVVLFVGLSTSICTDRSFTDTSGYISMGLMWCINRVIQGQWAEEQIVEAEMIGNFMEPDHGLVAWKWWRKSRVFKELYKLHNLLECFDKKVTEHM